LSGGGVEGAFDNINRLPEEVGTKPLKVRQIGSDRTVANVVVKESVMRERYRGIVVDMAACEVDGAGVDGVPVKIVPAFVETPIGKSARHMGVRELFSIVRMINGRGVPRESEVMMTCGRLSQSVSRHGRERR